MVNPLLKEHNCPHPERNGAHEEYGRPNGSSFCRACGVEIEPEKFGWIVGNGDGTKWRTWKDGWSDWTEDRNKATRYHRRQDAEAVHQENEDAWSVVPYE